MYYLEDFIKTINDNGLWEGNKTISRNDCLCQPGVLDTNIYYIEEGSVRIFKMIHDEESILRFGYQNNLIMALDSYVTNRQSNLFIQALKKN